MLGDGKCVPVTFLNSLDVVFYCTGDGRTGHTDGCCCCTGHGASIPFSFTRLQEKYDEPEGPTMLGGAGVIHEARTGQRHPGSPCRPTSSTP